MKKLVIFDFDGVIMDNLPVLFRVYDVICERLGVRKLKSQKEIVENNHGDWKEFYRYLKIKEKDFDKADEIFKEIYIKLEKEISIFYGMKEIIEKLAKKFKLVIASTNLRQNIEAGLKRNNLFNEFDLIFDGEDVENHKPSPEQLIKCMSKLKVTPEETIYIGDTFGDIIAAKNAGVEIIAVTWGWRNWLDLKKLNPNFIANKPEDLLKLIK